MSSDSEIPESRLQLLSLEGSSPKKGPLPNSAQPKLRARVRTLAPEPEVKTKSFADASKTERIFERIRKCFARGQHPNTPEAEAKSALSMAAKLMAQYNVSYADTLATEESEEGGRKPVGDQSVVEITHVDGKRVRKPAFTGTLSSAMATFFDCECYYLTNSVVKVVFYGLAHNTAAAAMAFEMCFNLISHWAMRKTGISAKHSYCVGVSRGLRDLAVAEKDARNKDHGKQLTVVDGERIAKEYLAAQNIKIGKGKATTGPRDRQAFQDGVKDSKKINVRGKRLEEK